MPRPTSAVTAASLTSTFAARPTRAEGAAEAGRVAGREQLLRIGAPAVAAQFRGGAQTDVQLAVGGDGAALAAVGGGGDSGVERVHGETFPLGGWWGGAVGSVVDPGRRTGHK
ncbi:hypothetical protein GCM10019016_007420 [Streptomyces prasinosporus]|uniref:Uncharacterized protein n=1 Tax=Streptomyces prasinosporus TaxID=68256 RepID=A0ABP6TFY0_9ACTN